MRWIRCPDCGGSGQEYEEEIGLQPCRRCGGRAEVPDDDGDDRPAITEPECGRATARSHHG